MSGPTEGRTVKQNEATIRNCLIAGNRGQGVHGGKPTAVNCTIVENLREGIDAYSPTVTNSILYFNNAGGAQIKSSRATVTYSDVQGGWEGDGNIDADPLFAAAGRVGRRPSGRPATTISRARAGGGTAARLLGLG